MIMKCDNQSSIKLANNPLYHARSKHDETDYHFVKENMQSKEIDLVYRNASENTSLQSLFGRQGLIKVGICQLWQKTHFSIKGECENNGENSRIYYYQNYVNVSLRLCVLIRFQILFIRSLFKLLNHFVILYAIVFWMDECKRECRQSPC